MKKILPILLALAVAAAAAFILIPSGNPAPEFRLDDLQGNSVDNSRLQNKVTLINFWFPSCPGCVTEMPKLIRMAQDYRGKDFQILGIAVPVDPPERVREYAASRRLPFQVMIDADKAVSSRFVKTELYPTSVLINKRGEILKTFVGEPDFAALYREVDEELAK